MQEINNREIISRRNVFFSSRGYYLDDKLECGSLLMGLGGKFFGWCLVVILGECFVVLFEG